MLVLQISNCELWLLFLNWPCFIFAFVRNWEAFSLFPTESMKVKMCQTDSWDLPDNNNILFQISSWCNKKVWLEGSRIFSLVFLGWLVLKLSWKGEKWDWNKTTFWYKSLHLGQKKHTCVYYSYWTHFLINQEKNGSIGCICSENLIY